MVLFFSAKDEKHREIFEKTFPELKKAREERERCGRAERLGNLKRSDLIQQEQVFDFFIVLQLSKQSFFG